MRAYVLDRFKTTGRLDDIPLPPLGANEIRVRVTAAGVNPIDWKIRAGVRPDLPLPRVLWSPGAKRVTFEPTASTIPALS
jgi:NADPH:quinone reductase-like Zn-dependent oxidoreductase